MTPQEVQRAEFIMETGFVSLSRTKTAELIPSGDVVISKRKLKADGTLEINAYEIFVDPQSCREITNKTVEIQKTMDEVNKGHLPNPSNIHLDASRIVQVSVYNGKPKFGMHKLTASGRIERCMGLNFTPEEFGELLDFFLQHFSSHQTEPLQDQGAAWEWIPKHVSI